MDIPIVFDIAQLNELIDQFSEGDVTYFAIDEKDKFPRRFVITLLRTREIRYGDIIGYIEIQDNNGIKWIPEDQQSPKINGLTDRQIGVLQDINRGVYCSWVPRDWSGARSVKYCSRPEVGKKFQLPPTVTIRSLYRRGLIDWPYINHEFLTLTSAGEKALEKGRARLFKRQNSTVNVDDSLVNEKPSNVVNIRDHQVQ